MPSTKLLIAGVTALHLSGVQLVFGIPIAVCYLGNALYKATSSDECYENDLKSAAAWSVSTIPLLGLYLFFKLM